jgi:hypothetical protein
MKTIRLVVFFFAGFLSFALSAQSLYQTHIIGRVYSPKFVAELVYVVQSNKDTLYDLTWHNIATPSMKNTVDEHAFFYVSRKSLTKNLYSAMKRFYLPENKSNTWWEEKVAVGKTVVTLSANGTSLNVYPGPGPGYFCLSENQVDQLFGVRR